MLTLKAIKDWLKPQVTDIVNAYTGKTDPTKEKVICIYGRASSNDKPAVGGVNNSTVTTKAISILIGWSKYYEESEIKAKSIYDIFNGQRAVIDGHNAFFVTKNDEPVPIGSNENGIFEFIIDLNIIYAKEVT